MKSQNGPFGTTAPKHRRRTEGLWIRSIELTLLGVSALAAGAGALLLGQQMTPSTAKAAETAPNAVHVLGLEGIKRDANGVLTVQGGTLEFSAGKAKADLSVASIQDVSTDEDMKEMVGGKAGTVVKIAAPYGSGRVLSLFAEKIDALTLEYRDSSGGLHGVIFTLPKGQADAVKKRLVQEGAQASVPATEPAK